MWAARLSSRTSRRGALFSLGRVLPVSALLWGAAAIAYPDGAPWGSARLDAAESCSGCHFESEPIADSAAIVLKGAGHANAFSPYEAHDFEIRFENADAVTAGFQLLASSSGADAGRFVSADADVEVAGDAARSIAPRVVDANTAWVLTWHAPSAEDFPVSFAIAISAANDDGSPFGDRIHYRVITLKASAPTAAPAKND